MVDTVGEGSKYGNIGKIVFLNLNNFICIETFLSPDIVGVIL